MSISPLGPFAVFVSTPPAVVEGMMDLAQVGPNDVVYDLGCGDGRRHNRHSSYPPNQEG